MNELNIVSPSNLEIFGTILFILAILHTFAANFIAAKAQKFEENSWQEKILHYLGEVECVFLLWSMILLLGITLFYNVTEAEAHVEKTNYTEAAFVFVIMFMAATRPMVKLTETILQQSSQILPFSPRCNFYLSILILGPLLGSFITEPAAMTVCALILFHKFFTQEMSTKFKYATIGLLFVNISIGGALTNFAAPPIVMVAAKWGWGSLKVFDLFGFKAIISIIISTSLYAFLFRKELQGKISHSLEKTSQLVIPFWLYILHFIFMFLVVSQSHHTKFFLGLFLLFLAFITITHRYQDKIHLRPALMVGIFLAGLVTLGDFQRWWLDIILHSINDLTLYLGATVLTAVTDNAALTYLGSLIELSDSAKYSLVAGAITGGGLTVIANAPNPAGYGILKESFPKKVISPLGLFIWALIPTMITMLCFELIPSLPL